MFTKTQVVIEKSIVKTDELNGLVNFSTEIPATSEFAHKVRGAVFDEEKLIFVSPPCPKTVIPKDIDLSKFKVTDMTEGTLIRVFFYKGEWFITTNRKLDAKKSKWGSQTSFYEMFVESISVMTGMSLEEFLDSLNKEIGYIFLIGTSEGSRIVSPSHTSLKIVNSFDMKTLKPVLDDNHFTLYVREHKFDSLSSLEKYVNSLSSPFSNSFGVFLYSENVCYKLENSEYSRLSSLRANNSSIPFSYVCNHFDEEKKMEFRNLYPKFTEVFDKYDEEIKIVCKQVYENYSRRHIKKEDFIVSKNEHNVLYHIHGFFLKNHERITPEIVYKVFASLEPHCLNKCLNERKQALKLAAKKNDSE